MKKIAQISLFCFVILALFIFNKKYFLTNNNDAIEPKITENQLVKKTENNLIKNLKYEIKLDQDNQYIITSELSELINSNELIELKNQLYFQQALTSCTTRRGSWLRHSYG